MKTENKEVFIKPQDLRKCSIEEIEDLIQETKQKILDLRTDAAQQFGYVEKPHLYKALRHLTARAETILREKQNADSIRPS